MSVSLTSANLSKLESATDTAAASAANTSSTSSSSTSSTGAFASMASNENNFLKLLTTQLQNQDPSSPMDSKDMAAQIAQFSQVEQQVQTNSNLKSLIDLQESSQLTQNKALVGQTATFSSSTLPLQSGKANISYSASSGQNIGISVADSSGTIVKHDVVSATGGTNSWTWDGTNDAGTKLADGAYTVAVKSIDSAGTTSDVSFTTSGTITGIQKGSSGVNVVMGGATIPLSSINSTT